MPKLTFETIFENCPFLKSLVEDKISTEVTAAKAENTDKIKKMQDTLDVLVAEQLGGK